MISPSHPRYRQLVLGVTMLGVAAGSFSNSLLVAVLPEIADDLDTTIGVVSWVNVAPAIAFAVSMPVFGKLGDLYGHRRVFLLGWTAAIVLSVATAAAPNAYWLIALRTAAQLAGTSTTPASFGILASVFPPDQRARAFGLVMSVLALSPVVAISAGGPLIAAIGWRSLFVGQGIIAALAVAGAVPLLPETPRKAGVRFDLPGACALAAGMIGLLLAINRLPEWGWRHRGIGACALCGVAGLVAFVIAERRAAEPLVPLAWFTRREITAPIATNFAVHAAFLGLVVSAPFLLRRQFDYSSTLTAWLTGLRPAFFGIGAATAGRVNRALGSRHTQNLGNLMVLASAVLTYFGARHHSIGLLIANFVIGGYGLGVARPAVVAAVNNAVSEADSGIANGLYSMAQMAGSSVGQTVVVAIVGTSAAAGAFADGALAAGVIALCAIACGTAIRFPAAAPSQPQPPATAPR